jgi:hypothetical protein
MGAVMNKLSWVLGSLCVAVSAAATLSGCSGSTGSQEAAWAETGRQYLLAAEPPDARPVIELRQLVEQAGRLEDISLVGRIDGLSQPTWDPDRAAFMVADTSLVRDEAEQDGAPQHDADNCPFCRAKTKRELAGLAMVEIVDQGGQVLPVAAQKLLGLSQGQTVVVRGDATLDALGTLVVHSGGLYVKPHRE